VTTLPTKLEESPLKNRLASGLIALFLIGVVALIAYGIQEARQALRLEQTHQDLKWIGNALHRYHDQHHHFPPVVELDHGGSPRHSWRAIIQPDLAAEAQTADDFQAYDFRQRWDSETNSDAVHRHRFGDHQYQFLAVVGPHAAWSREGTRKWSEFKDGTSNTILVIGIRDTGISWNEPRDAEFDGQIITIGGRPLDKSQPLFVLMADGSVRYGLTSEFLAPLLTIDAGDVAPVW
jgi:Protein of unknown function (DUF1559)